MNTAALIKDVQLLQSTLGNRAVNRLLNRRSQPAEIRQIAAAGARGQGERLPHADAIQRAFGGHDIGRVQSYTHDTAAAACRAVGAAAYTTGDRVAFSEKSPSLRTAAHEAAHVVQQRSGVELRDGVGQNGDVYERHADAVADAVAQGRSAEGLLNRMDGAGAGPRQGVQRIAEDISGADLDTMLNRAQQRSGKVPSIEKIEDSKKNSTEAMVVRDASMAESPEFEQAATKWEAAFGGVAYNDQRAKKVVDDGAKKAVSYLTKKYGEWKKENKDLKDALEKTVGFAKPGTAGAVEANVEAVMRALTTGELRVKVFHLDAFCNKLLAGDLLKRDNEEEEYLKNLLAAAKDSGMDDTYMSEAAMRVREAKDRYALHEVEGEALGQWHTRAARDKGNEKQEYTDRTVKDLKALNIGLDPDELSLMNIKDENEKLKWKEGARIWALNERDKWVFAMRQMSLPLSAGVSGTTSRLMKNLQMLKVGDPASNRLACIAYLLPPRHHSLVEIMEGASANGGPKLKAGPLMYHSIEPFTEKELRESVGPFPDEVVLANANEEDVDADVNDNDDVDVDVDANVAVNANADADVNDLQAEVHQNI